MPPGSISSNGGEEAEHAGWFDIDWQPDRTDIQGKVLVPFLGDQYGKVLQSGGLVLKFDAAAGALAIWAHDSHKLPLCPLDYGRVLGRDDPRLFALGDAFADLLRWRPQIMRRARDLKDELATLARDPESLAAIEAAVAGFHGQDGDFAGWMKLDGLIARQSWRPAHYLVASDDINYRRFFNIATLAGIRMELPHVFDETHQLVFSMIRAGVLDGLRIDHVDGLFDPKGYLERLRSEAPRPAEGHLTLLVEKILGPGEALRDDWPIEGTTGYDVTNLLTGLFVQSANEGAFTRLYKSFTGETRSFEAIVHGCKLQIMDDEMGAELQRLARGATRVARQDPRTADFTRTGMLRAMRLLVSAFPVYRTYVDGRSPTANEDRDRLDRALASSRGIDTAIEPSIFDFLRALLTGDLAAEPGGTYGRSAMFRCAMAFQQYCGPVMAKGVEDTAFYRYNRLIALNEVGGTPERFGLSIDAVHAANAERAARWPAAMLATSTHDTKRGEDTRARLAALSTIPEAWDRAVRHFSEVLRLASGSPALPDRNDRFLLFQLLVGTWPLELLGAGEVDRAILDPYVERLKGALTKSMREAKVHSTWTTPDETYEAAMMALVDGALTGEAASRFLAAFRPVADEVATLGASNSFVQTVLKFTIAGLPDIYQGCESWDLTMVDPDNRRPIDYDARDAALKAIDREDVAAAEPLVPRLWSGWRDGRFKLGITRALLKLRADDPDLFATGGYQSLTVSGDEQSALFAFARTGTHATLVVIVRRFPGVAFGDATVALPAVLTGRRGTSLFSGGSIDGTQTMAASRLLGALPGEVYRFPLA